MIGMRTMLEVRGFLALLFIRSTNVFSSHNPKPLLLATFLSGRMFNSNEVPIFLYSN